MIDEVIQVISTEQKPGSKGSYLEVFFRNEKGEEHKKNIFDQTLWDLFLPDAWVRWHLEKEGNWWNVKKAEGVKEGIDKLKENLDESIKGQKDKPTEPAPQAVGMTTKELGDMIRSKQLIPIFGVEVGAELVKWYRSQILGTTRIPFDGAKLPKIIQKEG